MGKRKVAGEEVQRSEGGKSVQVERESEIGNHNERLIVIIFQEGIDIGHRKRNRSFEELESKWKRRSSVKA